MYTVHCTEYTILYSAPCTAMQSLPRSGRLPGDMLNAFINHKTHSRKLQFCPEKCKKLHIGKTKEKFKCQDLYVGGWKMKNIKNVDTGSQERIETFEESEQIESVEQEKYLGDIISIDGKYTKTIQNRINKGEGAITNILQILQNIYLGKYHFVAAAALRNSLLISSMLFNCETWYNVPNVEIERLERIDEQCIRRIMKAPHGTPKVLLYLEMGLTPIRFIIQKRRLMFLQYILQENKDSLINKFLKIQIKTPTKQDWGSLVVKDIEDLDINLTLDEIENLSKRAFKKIVNDQLKMHAFIQLQNKKKSKSKDVIHENLDMEEYLAPNDNDESVHAKQFAFKCRARMLNLKYNMKNKGKDIACSACGEEEETLLHILQCQENINEPNKVEKTDMQKIYSTDREEMFKTTKNIDAKMKYFLRKYKSKLPLKNKKNNSNQKLKAKTRRLKKNKIYRKQNK